MVHIEEQFASGFEFEEIGLIGKRLEMSSLVFLGENEIVALRDRIVVIPGEILFE